MIAQFDLGCGFYRTEKELLLLDTPLQAILEKPALDKMLIKQSCSETNITKESDLSWIKEKRFTYLRVVRDMLYCLQR